MSKRKPPKLPAGLERLHRGDLDRRWRKKEIDSWQWFRSRLAFDWRWTHTRTHTHELDRVSELQEEWQRQVAVQKRTPPRPPELVKLQKLANDQLWTEGIRQAYEILGTDRDRQRAIALLDAATDERNRKEPPRRKGDMYRSQVAAQHAAGKLREQAACFVKSELRKYEQAVSNHAKHLTPEEWRRDAPKWAWNETSDAGYALESLGRALKSVEARKVRVPPSGKPGRPGEPDRAAAIVGLVDLLRSKGLKTSAAVASANSLLIAAGLTHLPDPKGLEAWYAELKKRNDSAP